MWPLPVPIQAIHWKPVAHPTEIVSCRTDSSWGILGTSLIFISIMRVIPGMDLKGYVGETENGVGVQFKYEWE